MTTFRTILKIYWKQIIVFLVPLLLLFQLFLVPEDVINKEANRCLYVTLLMAVYWCTAALPIAATALIPVFLLPSMGLLTARETCSNYMSSTLMFFAGGLMFALAIEKCNLHRRIAMTIISRMGTQPMWLMLGFMLPTWFLSMWISNTATTAMMLPIAEAVIRCLEKTGQDIELDSQHSKEHLGSESEILPSSQIPASQVSRFAKGIILAIAYSANIGGISSLTGTLPNIVMKAYADDLWMKHGFEESPITFTSWLFFGLLTSLVNFLIMWLWLTFFFNGIRGLTLCRQSKDKEQDAVEDKIRLVIGREIRLLGKITKSEVGVITMFVILVLLWFFRSPGFMPGWGQLFPPGYAHDAMPAIAVAIALCIIPATIEDEGSTTKIKTLLDWTTIQTKLPWGSLLVVGGGVALAQAFSKSGLSVWLADHLTGMKTWPDVLMLATLCAIVAMMTEICSNTATCTLLLPIVSRMAMVSGKNPIYLMLPVAITTSFAFMLPVATPPNVFAVSTGRVKTWDMIKTGFPLNIISVGIVTFATHTYGDAYFKFDVIPWSNNGTDVDISVVH